MQQRRPRLGDILDDYCPRERRVTNHAIVAIVDDEVRQTRCTTCDSEHEYRQAKVPAPRRPKSRAALTHESADGVRPVLTASRPALEPAPTVAEADLADVLDAAEGGAVPEAPPAPVEEPPPIAFEAAPPSESADAGESADARDDDGPVHRRLIRATFPRPEGHTPERREPEFTIRQPGTRGREVDGNRFGARTRNQRQGQHGAWNYGGRHGGFGPDGQRGGRGSGPGGTRQGGGPPRGGQRHGGAGRKGGR
jgi:hypothetical protein